MRYAIIDQAVPGAIPANVLSVVDSDDDLPALQAGQGLVCDPPDGVAQGWVFAASTFSAAPPIPTATGNQWAFALSDLGLSSSWMAGVAKSKPSDQVRIGLIARDTPLVASDPLLIRVAGNAGADASGKPLVDVPTVHAHAQGMPT